MRRREKPLPQTRLPAGVTPPPELLDPEHEVWRSWPAHRSFMADRGWTRSMDPRDRLRIVDPELVGAVPVVESPVRWRARRQRAVQAWARQYGVPWEAVRPLIE